MNFAATPIEGAFRIEPEFVRDNRGLFACAFDEREFARRGLNTRWKQHNFSVNRRLGTLRGMHYQEPPHAEVKLVWCPHGAIYDVLLDLRPDSSTRGRWAAFDLTAENGVLLYIPTGVAHGFQTLADGTVVSYQVSELYHPPDTRGVRYDDPAYAIRWPLSDPILSEKDMSYPPKL